MGKALEKVIASVDGFVVRRGNGHEKADLLIYDIGQDYGRDLEQAQLLMNLGMADTVFLTSAIADPAVLMQAIRIGAREFISQPVNAGELREILLRLRKNLDSATARLPGDVITFMGSKGGVGTTTVAVNLAVSLQRQSVRGVALVDMNLLFGEVPLFLNFKPKYTWAEIAKNISRLDDSFLTDVLFAHSSGIHVLPSPNMLKSADVAIPDMFMRILSHMRRMFDFIVIDGGNALGDLTQKTLEVSNRAFLVSLLSLPCLSNTAKLLRTFEAWGYPPRSATDIIINRHIRDSEISIGDAEKSTGRKIFWKIPNDYGTTMSAINQGVPLPELAPKSPVTRSFCELARELAPADEQSREMEKVFFRKLRILKPMFKGA
jgi:pilus assembly protein CpaE